MKNIIGIALGSLLLAGCATPTTGVVPKADGYMAVTRQGAGAWVTTDSLRTEATLEAQKHCQSSGKTLKVINTKEIQGGMLGRWPEAEVLFRCD